MGKECYSEEALALFRKLVVDERCSSPMITEITGISSGSVDYLLIRLGLELNAKIRFMKGRHSRTASAIHISSIRRRYEKEIARLIAERRARAA